MYVFIQLIKNTLIKVYQIEIIIILSNIFVSYMNIIFAMDNDVTFPMRDMSYANRLGILAQKNT